VRLPPLDAGRHRQARVVGSDKFVVPDAANDTVVHDPGDGPLFSTYDLDTADDEMFGAAVNGRPQCLPLLKDTAVH
jgi:hypothetical protein